MVASTAAATASMIAPDPVLAPQAEVQAPPVREVTRPAPQAPLVIVRKPVEAPPAPASSGNAVPAAKPPAALTGPTPVRKGPKAPKAKPAPAPKPEKSKERRKEAEKRERKHRRHSKRITRRAASLDLKDGERVSLSIEGWSRFRRATLVVTNYRVALIARVSPRIRWIPLEEVSTVSRRWRGTWSVLLAAPTEVLTLQKSKGQMLASFQELLDSEVREARTAGSQRHHPDITQEWCDRATMVWDSRLQRILLWVRRRPVLSLVFLVVCAAGAFYLTSVLTSFFSPVR